MSIRFKEYKDYFLNLTHRSTVLTKDDIISMQISYDSEMVLTMLKASAKIYFIRMYYLDKEDYHEIKIKGNSLKCKDIEQTNDGLRFCVPYYDAGEYKFIVFEKNKIICHVNVTRIIWGLEIDN